MTDGPARPTDSRPGPKADRPWDVWTRRQMLARSAAFVVTLTVVDGAVTACTVGEDAPDPARPTTVALTLVVNGRRYPLELDSRTSLLDALREHLNLTGAKKGCDHGQCGACTVLLDDRRVASCLTLAAQADGRGTTTIEGLERADGQLHPMQQAFVDNDALQCGYCTPGQIMAAVACVSEGHTGSTEEIREYMSGNLCRCGAYLGIVAAIQQAAPQLREG